MENKVRLTTILWLKYFSYIVILVIFIISLFNFVINPYGLFPHNHKLNTIKNHILSDRMTQYYNFKHNKPNVIMMGTSRIGLYPSNYLEKYFPKTSKISNMALAGSSIYEQSAYLKSYIQEGNISTIIWSLDFFSFNPTKIPNATFKIERVTNSFFFQDYMEGVFNFKTFANSLKTTKENLSKSMNIKEKDQPFNENQIKQNIQATLDEYKRDKSFLNSEEFKNPKSIDKNLDLIKEVAQMAQKHNIKLIIYISPVFQKHLDLIEVMGLGDTYLYLKNSLPYICSFYDFGTKNEVTQNFLNFRDSSHTVSSIGKLIFGKIFQDKNLNIPSDFGKYYEKKSNIIEIN